MGLYFIEDWAWSHWQDFQAPKHQWANETALTRLVIDLVEAAGTSAALIASMIVYQGFAVVERGVEPLIPPQTFSLDEFIIRRPRDSARESEQASSSSTIGFFSSFRRRLAGRQ